MTGPEPDEFDLELELAGEPSRGASSDPSLAPARAEIEAYRAYWTAHRRPLLVVRRRRWPWVVVALAAAAAVLLAVWPSQPAFQARGHPSVAVSRIRDERPVEPGEPVLPGDELAVALVVDGPRFVSVASLQDDGTVELLLVGRPASPDRSFEVPGRIALDAWPGREWLVVVASPEAATPDAVRASVLALLPDPRSGPDRWVTEITRGRGLR